MSTFVIPFEVDIIQRSHELPVGKDARKVASGCMLSIYDSRGRASRFGVISILGTWILYLGIFFKSCTCAGNFRLKSLMLCLDTVVVLRTFCFCISRCWSIGFFIQCVENVDASCRTYLLVLCLFNSPGVSKPLAPPQSDVLKYSIHGNSPLIELVFILLNSSFSHAIKMIQLR